MRRPPFPKISSLLVGKLYSSMFTNDLILINDSNIDRNDHINEI
jgi:hypothetical protein